MDPNAPPKRRITQSAVEVTCVYATFEHLFPKIFKSCKDMRDRVSKRWIEKQKLLGLKSDAVINTMVSDMFDAAGISQGMLSFAI